MFRMFAKVVLCNPMTSDMSGGFLLMKLLYLWLMVFLLVGRIIATHFSGVSQSLTILVYKFFHTGLPKYFAPYLSSHHSSYSTRHSQSGGNFLVIPKLYPSIHKSVKQFGYSFAFDALTVWNVLPDEICASPSQASFRKLLKTYLYTKANPL